MTPGIRVTRGMRVDTTERHLYTIGHSTRSLEEFLHLLRASQIACLADVRTFPRSRHVPQFNRDALQVSLSSVAPRYVHLPRLGGLRRGRGGESPNTGWRGAGFRAFADYMQTDEFARGLDELWELTGLCRTAIMCAEALHRRCHRSLIADAFTVRGGVVSHILAELKIEAHRMPPFAVVLEGRVTYPSSGFTAPSPERR